MNSVMENLLTRRSVRAFSDREIHAEELNQILKAAKYAPSGRNLQTWQFTAILDQEKIERLAAVIAKELAREGYDMYKPRVLIIPSNEKDSPYGMEDNACALENIFLAAHSFGIGSVWINQLRDICDRPSVRSLLSQWGVPDDHTVYGMAALGYPASVSEKAVEKKGKIVIVN